MTTRIGHTTTRHPLCPNCGYDLVATIDAGRRICPECGEEFELHEVIRSARPDDWTLARGIARLLLRLLWRGAIALLVWVAALWVADLLIAGLGPRLPASLRIAVLLISAVIVLGTAGWTGHFLTHDVEEHAGFGGLLLLAIVIGTAWLVILAGVLTMVAFGLISGSISLGLVFVACLLATVIGVRTYLAAQF